MILCRTTVVRISHHWERCRRLDTRKAQTASQSSLSWTRGVTAPAMLGERCPSRIVVVDTPRDHGEGIDRLEVQHSFGAELDLLTLLGRCYSGPCTSSACRADGSAFASSNDATQNRTRSRADTNFGCGILAFALAGARPLVGLDVIGLAVDGQRSQFQGQNGISRKSSGAFHISHAANYVGSGWITVSPLITIGVLREPRKVSPT